MNYIMKTNNKKLSVMRKIILLNVLLFFYVATYSQNIMPTATEALVKVIVTNHPNEPVKVSFSDKKTKKTYSGLTDNDGKLSILLPKGDTFDVECKSFDEEALNTTLIIPQTDAHFTMNFTIAYSSSESDSKTISSQNNTANRSNETLLKVLVTDLENNPNKGIKVIFTSKKTKKEYFGVTKDDGKFSISIPKRDTFVIKCQSFESDEFYSEISSGISDVFSYTLRYELPKTYTLKDVYFDTGKATLRPESNNTLNNLAELMQYQSSLVLELSGHTDNVGDDNSNKILSEQRAQSVKNYLIKKGISADRVVAVGYGESMPVASNDTDSGRQQNRRTEVKILKE